MLSSIQRSQNFDIAAAPMQVEEREKFIWDEKREAIFNSACVALIYLNGGGVELKKERMTNGKQKSPLSAKPIEYILKRGNFPEFKTVPPRVVESRLAALREKSRKKGSTLEEELLEQYQDLQATTIVNDKEDNVPLLLEELNKFGIQPEEYDQWVPIASCSKWDKEMEDIFTSACIALIYLNGGEVELKKERMTQGAQKSPLSAKPIEYVLQRGNFPQFKTLPKMALSYHLDHLRRKSERSGSTLEEELLKQYQDLQAKTIVNAEGEEIPALLAKLNKFGIRAEEYDQWLSIESCFKWDEEREEIFTSACLALLYLNGGQLELSEERIMDKRVTKALSPTAIEHILQRGNFPEFKTINRQSIKNNITLIKNIAQKNGSTWEEEILNQYEELERTTVFNDAVEEIPAIWKELEKFGIKPDDYDCWTIIQSKAPYKRRNLQKEPAGEPLEERQKFIWDEKREAIFNSACIALIYLNGGEIELQKERVTHGKQKNAVSPQGIEYVLQRGNFPEFTTVSRRVLDNHLVSLREKSKKRGSTLEEELLKQYQDLQGKTIVNEVGEESPALLAELNKFGIQAEEYNQWMPIESCFRWDQEREELFTSACVALIYLNGGQVELKKEKAANGHQKSALSAQAIEYILQRGNFPQFKTLSKGSIPYNLAWLKKMSRTNETTWEEEILNKYQELERTTVFDDAGEEIPAIWKEVEKFGIKPDDYDSWEIISKAFSKRRNERKRPAEEPADPEAEPQEKRANRS